jgi:hypothetical protein
MISPLQCVQMPGTGWKSEPKAITRISTQQMRSSNEACMEFYKGCLYAFVMILFIVAIVAIIILTFLACTGALG